MDKHQQQQAVSVKPGAILSNSAVQQRQMVGQSAVSEQQYSLIVQQRKQSKSKIAEGSNGGSGHNVVIKGKQSQPKLELVQQEPLTQVQRWSELQRVSGKGPLAQQVSDSLENVVKCEHPAETLKGVVFAKKGHSINASYESKGGGTSEIIKDVKMRSPTDFDYRVNANEGKVEPGPFTTPKHNRQPTRLQGQNQPIEQSNLVQASSLFNARADNSAKRVAVLPNLTQRSQLGNVRNNQSVLNGVAGPATSASGSKQLMPAFKPTILVEEKSLGVSDFQLARGLQNASATDCDGNRMSVMEERTLNASFASMQMKFQARKASHQPSSNNLKVFQQDVRQRVQQKRHSNMEQANSYGQLPKIPLPGLPVTIVHAAQKAHGVPILTASQSHLLRTKDERLVVGNHGMGGGLAAFNQPVQGENVKFIYKTPSFDLQGKGLLDQQLLKKYSIETLQRIRAQAVMAPNVNSSVNQITNQFQPMSPLSRNQQLIATNTTNKARQHGNKSPRGAISPDHKTMENYHTVQVQSQQQKKNQRKQTVSDLAGDKNQQDLAKDQLNQKNQNSRWIQDEPDERQSGNNTGQSISKQKEFIKTDDQGYSRSQIGDDGQEQHKMEFDEDGNLIGQAFFGSKSQLTSPLATVGDGARTNSEANFDDLVVSKRKELQNTGATKQKNAAKPTTKKGGAAADQRRQFSQAQRKERNSLVGVNKQGRHVNTGKADNASNSRAVAMNNPLMQPPPQILQSKIIIHLLKTEYPLIEQVAKQEMGWRVTKSENQNAEFDVYWNDIGIDNEKLQSLKPYQKTNHFPAMFQITRKVFLAKNLKRLQKLYPLEFDFFPRTWVVPAELTDLRQFALYKPKKAKETKAESPIKKPSEPQSTSNTNNVAAIQKKAETVPTTAVKPRIQDSPRISSTNNVIENSNNNNQKAREQRPVPLSSHDEIARNGFKLSQTLPSSATAKNNHIAHHLHKSVYNTADEESEDSAGDDDDEEEESDGVSDLPNNNAAPAVAQKEPSPAKRVTVIREARKAPVPSHQQQKPVKLKTRFPMIIKPDCSSQGKGIFLSNDIDQIPKDDTYVVQQYMQNPYLLDGLKFDLRLYVLVLSCEPLKIFLYEEGLVRFATHKFKPLDATSEKNEFNNFFMHLTNYAINKESDDFKAAKSINDDTGHKRTLKKVLERLKQDGEDTDRIMGEIKDVIVKTLICIQQELAHNYRTCQPADLESLMCFEILGFDIILDDKCKPILLEVNQAPSFATDSPLDYDIKKGLFMDTFRLLGLSVDKKKQKLKRLYEEKKDRMLTKLTLKQKNQMRRQAINQFQKEQEVFETANNGRFERIYPLPVKEASESNNKSQSDQLLTVSQKQLAQSQYQALQRQQERYNQLLATLSSTDIEKAIRAQNRQAKEDPSAGANAKLKAKKTEKKPLNQSVGQRNISNLKKPTSEMAAIQPQTLHLQPEETFDEAMRNSVMKPVIHMETPTAVRQSYSDRFNEPHRMSSRGGTATSNDPGQQGFTMKQASQQFQHIVVQPQNTRESINLDQNIKNFIELQQRLGLSSPTVAHGQHTKYSGMMLESANGVNQSHQKKPSYNFVQAGLPNHSEPLTGRTHTNKNNVVILTEDGLTGPNLTQLQYATPGAISQSQNPINMAPKNFKTANIDSAQYDSKMNRTQGQSNSRQGNLLPNIARNMIPAEKSSAGFTQVAQPQPGQQNEFATRAHPHHRAGFRGSMQAVSTSQSAASKQNPSSTVAVMKNSPKRGHANNAERASLQRTSIQSFSKQQTLNMKTQQMNLGTKNIQPVIIDSANLGHNQQLLEGGQKMLGNQQNTKSPISSIPLGGGSSYKTQKFSKIQLQSIIDNLYQYDANGKAISTMAASTTNTNRKGMMSLSTPHEVSQTSRQGGIKPILANTQMHLPDVGRSEAIAKQYNNVAGLALDAIASVKSKHGNLTGTPSDKPTSPAVRRNTHGSDKNVTKATNEADWQARYSATEYKDAGQNHPDQSRFVNYRNMISNQAAVNGAATVQTLSPQQQKQVTQALMSPSRSGDSRIQDAASGSASSVINFNNCHVTIINNNYEGTPEASSTIIKANKVSNQGAQAPNSNYLSKINEVSTNMTPRAGNEN